jgi:hypothetical protein
MGGNGPSVDGWPWLDGGAWLRLSLTVPQVRFGLGSSSMGRPNPC